MLAFSGLAVLIVALFCSITVNGIPTIQAVGSKFFTSNGNQWFIKGIAYQLTENDPLVDVDQCTRDAALMQQLGANAIRVYHVDADADHSGCMNAFANVGIYLFVDLDSFKTYIRYDTTPSWTQNKSDSYRAVMDSFQQYDNTAGFFIGNEVLNTLNDSGSAPYLLAATVDLKAYRTAKNYRQIPIGYSATDTDALPMLQDYLVCRSNATERLEFYALNSYRWCGESTTYSTSGYDQLQAAALGYPVPIFFSETGCNTVPPRNFADQAAILGPDMDGTWSGAIIYEWIEELNNYGLISYGPEQSSDVQVGSSVVQGFTRQGIPTPIQPDFSNLQAQWQIIKSTGVSSSAYVNAISTKSRTCPAFTSGGWTVDPSAALPTLGDIGLASVTPASTTTGKASGTTSTSKPSTGAGSKAVSHTLSTPILDVGILGMSAFLAVTVGAIMCWL